MAALAFTACPTDGGSSSSNGNTITEKIIQGIALPEVGKTPVTTITANNQFSGTVTWDPPHITFQPKIGYKAIVNLQPVGSFTLSGVPANHFEVPGAMARNAAGSGRVEAVFPATGGDDNDPSIVSLVNIEISRPKTGVAAAKYIDNIQYSGTINWEPGVGETFALGQIYTATVNLTAKRGFSFSVTSSGWSIAGAPAEFRNTGGGFAEVKATFPVTTNDATPISNPKISLSSPPRTGDLAASIMVRDTVEYSATIEWLGGVADMDTDPPTFADGTVSLSKEEWNGRFKPGPRPPTQDTNFKGPEARISLLPKPGYTLDGVPENYFYIEGFVTQKNIDGKQILPKNNADKGVVTFIFPKMDMIVYNARTPRNITGLDVPQKDITSPVVINTNDDFIGYITWDPPVPTIPSNQFKSRTQYTATITMEPRPGFTVFGVPANFWTLTGAFLVENAKNSNVVTAKFPTTDPETWEDVVTIDGLLINLMGYEADATIPNGVYMPPLYGPDGVTVVTPAVPGLKIGGTDQFEYEPGNTTTGLQFIPDEGPGGRFKAGKTYTAYFAVKARTTPAPGFTLEGVQANTFKVVVNDPVKGIVRATEHAANSGVITVNLGPVPLKKVSSSSAAATAEAKTRITGVKKPVTGVLGNNLDFDVDTITAAGDAANIGTRYFKKADGAKIVWEPPLPSVGTFKNQFVPNTQYKAILKLKDGDVYQLDDGMSPGFFVTNGTFDNGAWNFGSTSYIKDDTPALITYGLLDPSGSAVPPNRLVNPAAPSPTTLPLVNGQPDWNNSNTVPNPYYDKTTKTLTLTFNRTEALVVGGVGYPAGKKNELVIPLTEPKTGAEPQRNLSTDYFTGTVTWTKADENDKEAPLDENGKFKPKVSYKAVVALRPTDWYKFAAGASFTVNTVIDTSGLNSVNVVGNPSITSIIPGEAYVTVTFNPTRDKIPERIKLDTLPVTGVAPSLGVGFYPMVSDSGLQFGSVVWTTTANPSGNLKGFFGSNLVYTAKFTLFLGGAYTLRGIDPSGYFKLVDANNAVVDGVTLTYDVTDPDARQVAITAVFPATRTSLQFLPSAEKKAAQQIPKAKAGSFHPDNSATVIRGPGAIDGPYYTGDIAWNKSTDNFGSVNTWDLPANVKFDKSGVLYQAVITLKAKAPYTFAGLFADGVHGFTATTGSGSAWFNLEDGKLVASGSPAKVGTYVQISSDDFVPPANYDAENDKVTVTVNYIKTEKTVNINFDRPIVHTELFNATPALRVPTALDTPSSAIPPGPLSTDLNVIGGHADAGYKITKLNWSKGALTTDATPQFQDDWTFTGTYTVQTLSGYTFKGIDNYLTLFQQAGVYLAEVQSTTVSSSTVTKVILVGYSTKPGIAVQPVPPSAPLAIGGTVDLRVTATVPDSTFEWFRNAANSTVGGVSLGTGTLSGTGYIVSTLQVTGDTTGTSYYYCFVTAPGATSGIPSNVVPVTVELIRFTSPLSTTPLIRAVGEAFSLSFTAVGPATITGTWYSNGSPTATGATALAGGPSTITSGTAATKSITAAGDPGLVYYYCEVVTSVDPVKKFYTGFVPVTVQNVRITTGLSATEKKLAVNGSGNTVTYTATGAATLSARWYRSMNSSGSGAQEIGTAANISSGSPTTYTIPNGIGDVGTWYYYCEVTSSAGAEPVKTDILKVTVRSSILTGDPVIEPDGTAIVAAGTMSGELLKDDSDGELTVSGISASGVGNIAYRWWSSNTQNGPGAPVPSAISGFNADTLSVPSTTIGSTWYWVVVTTDDGVASVTSDPYKVEVAEAFITYTPAVPGVSGTGFSSDFELIKGNNVAQLTVTATLRQPAAAGSLRYEWRTGNGTVALAGTNASYTLPIAVYNTVGYYSYYCVISVWGISGISTKQTLPANVQVFNTTESFINITAQPADVEYTDTSIGSPAAVSITAAPVGTSVGPLSFEWYQITSGSSPTGNDTSVQPVGGTALTAASITALNLDSSGGDDGKYYFYCLITDTAASAAAASKRSRVVTITVTEP